VALQLKRKGIVRVRPLSGGLDQWMKLEFPIAGLKLNAQQPEAV
jgi:hypothetical protein